MKWVYDMPYLHLLPWGKQRWSVARTNARATNPLLEPLNLTRRKRGEKEKKWEKEGSVEQKLCWSDVNKNWTMSDGSAIKFGLSVQRNEFLLIHSVTINVRSRNCVELGHRVINAILASYSPPLIAVYKTITKKAADSTDLNDWVSILQKWSNTISNGRESAVT